MKRTKIFNKRKRNIWSTAKTKVKNLSRFPPLPSCWKNSLPCFKRFAFFLSFPLSFFYSIVLLCFIQYLFIVVLSFCPFSLFCYFFLNFSLFCYFFVYPFVVLFLSLSFSCSIFFVYLYIDWCYFIFLSSPIYFFFLISLIDYLSISLSSHIL